MLVAATNVRYTVVPTPTKIEKEGRLALTAAMEQPIAPN